MTADAGIDLRIFIVGAPRSGTTLVQSLLAAHSAVTSYTESHFFSRHFTLLPISSRPVLTQNPVPRLRDFLTENSAARLDAAAWFESRSRVLRWRPLLPFLTRSVARQLMCVLDEMAQRRGCACWIEKTPMHLRYIPYLESLSERGSIRFVHVIRQGLEVVSSLHLASQSWERPYDLMTCAERWNADVGYSLGRTGSPNDLFVVYEELTSGPQAALERLVGELGLGWEPGLLEGYGQASAQLVTGQEPWKADVGRSIRPSATSHRTLSAEQQALVHTRLRHELYEQLLESVGQRP
jgi:hypothetical protein